MSTGLFPVDRNPASTYANKRRAPIRRKLQYAKMGKAASARQRGKKRGPYKSPKRDVFAELLSQDLNLADIAVQMGITPKAAERQLAKLRKRLGPQAI